ncbi:MAG: prepilin peptidase [bacterium]|nr:prepilin peptidase [bacterium]
MEIILTAMFFVLGLIIGSFLNVVILRYNTQKDLGGRSACMSCAQKLQWYELVPLFSYLGLMGRCKTCKTKISIQYPLVECLTGLLFVFLFSKFATLIFADNLFFAISFGYYAIIFSVLIVIAVYDLKHKIIPDLLVFIFGILAFIGLFLFTDNIFAPHWPTLLELLSGVILALPFAFLWIVSSGRWMGFGDAKLAIGMGYLVGLSGGISAFFIASIIGAIVGILLILQSRKYGMKTEIPFAPFLVLGTFLVFLLGFNLLILY